MNYTASSLKRRDFCAEQQPCFIFPCPLSACLHLSNIPVRNNESRLLPAVNPFKQIKKDKVLSLGSVCTCSSSERLGRSQHYPFLYLWSLILLLTLFSGSFEVPGSRSLGQLCSATSEDFDLSQTVTKTPLH